MRERKMKEPTLGLPVNVDGSVSRRGLRYQGIEPLPVVPLEKDRKARVVRASPFLNLIGL